MARVLELLFVNPTYVGMDRQWPRLHLRGWRKPHVCGDGPVICPFVPTSFAVNPTYVGMDRYCDSLCRESRSKPHVCGDGPDMEELVDQINE